MEVKMSETEFTKEELDALKKATEKLLIGEEEADANFPKFDPIEFASHQYDEIFNNQAFLDAPVELVFMVSCNVLNKNTKGEIISTSQAVVENYHIPLNNGKQAELCIQKFFDKFKGNLQSSASETLSDNVEKETK
jgi:hypothetical protein